MYNKLLKTKLFLFIALVQANLFAIPFQVNKSLDNIELSTANYSIVVQKSNFGLVVNKNNLEVLKLSNNSPLQLENNETQATLSFIFSKYFENDKLLFVYTTNFGDTVQISLTPRETDFTVDVKVNSKYSKIGFNINLQNETSWYGGNITTSQNWPLNNLTHAVEPFYSCSNQTSPIWLCSNGTGIFVNTVQTMGYSFTTDSLFSFHVKEAQKLHLTVAVTNNIAEAHKSIINLVGKPQAIPPFEYFSNTIFNSWIEFKTDVNQEGLLKYSEKIRKHNIPCTVLEIDDMWTPAYGEFEFDSKKFANPAEMVKKLQSDSFKLALWVTPFVEKKAKTYKFLLANNFLIMEPNGKKPFIATWWNGEAALIDLSNPKAYQWFLAQLNNLVSLYGVNGFKLDAGDADFLGRPFKSYGNITTIEYTDLFAGIGKYFEINELRVSWLTQPLGLVQRLRDKHSTWSADQGLGSLVPHGITEGLIGYPYFCPDMIGGGELGNFTEVNSNGIDQELFVRWVQASTFMPMMQYSYAPWRLDSANFAISLKYTLLHKKLGKYIYSLANEAMQNGKPIVRALFYEFPNDPKTYSINNQFMLGNKFLVAPVIEKGAQSRNVYLPAGTWIDYWNGNIYEGNVTLQNYPAPLEKLPVFIQL